MTARDEDPWYKDGLCFNCSQCGNCCSGRCGPGYVWVNKEEIGAIAELLNLEITQFAQHYLRLCNGRYALLETAEHDCIFLKNNSCAIYEKRPKQCRTFPWWKKNLESPESWEEAKKICTGINDTSPTFTREQIDQALSSSDS